MTAERDKLDERSQQFPCECPSCRQRSGVPKSAATIPGEPFKVRLSMHCPQCQHNWTYEKISEQADQ